MLVATRVLLDHKHPCLACGAPWRVRTRAQIAMDSAEIRPEWVPEAGECSARCWCNEPDTYTIGLQERTLRGWVGPSDVRL